MFVYKSGGESFRRAAMLQLEEPATEVDMHVDDTKDSEHSTGKTKKALTLILKFISGIHIQNHKAGGEVYCNVAVEDSITKVSCASAATKGFLRFEETPVKLCDIVEISEHANCAITLVMEGAVIPVGSFSMEDLLIAENAIFEHFFQLPTQHNQCKISMVASLE